MNEPRNSILYISNAFIVTPTVMHITLPVYHKEALAPFERTIWQ